MNGLKKLLLFAAALLLLTGCGAKSGMEQPESRQDAGKTLYTTVVHYSGEDDNKKYLQIAERSQKLFPLLEEHLGAFVVNAYNFQNEGGEPLYTLNTLHYPAEIDPYGKCIEVSKNYFSYFPVETADGSGMETQLSADENTLDLLVPERFREKEADILSAYRDAFYFEKVTAFNKYNQSAGRSERSALTLEDLSVHIIYVKDGQRYFVPGSNCITEDGGWLTEPIVKVYDAAKVHCNYAHSNLSQWTYFYADTPNAEDAFALLLPDVKACGAEESFQKVSPAERQP